MECGDDVDLRVLAVNGQTFREKRLIPSAIARDRRQRTYPPDNSMRQMLNPSFARCSSKDLMMERGVHERLSSIQRSSRIIRSLKTSDRLSGGSFFVMGCSKKTKGARVSLQRHARKRARNAEMDDHNGCAKFDDDQPMDAQLSDEAGWFEFASHASPCEL
jgi:hypothetical protein